MAVRPPKKPRRKKHERKRRDHEPAGEVTAYCWGDLVSVWHRTHGPFSERARSPGTGMPTWVGSNESRQTARDPLPHTQWPTKRTARQSTTARRLRRRRVAAA